MLYIFILGCNNTFEKNNSRFDLNNHTLINPCHWTINGSGHQIILFFVDIFLHEKDELNIYRTLEDAENNTNPLLKNNISSQNGKSFNFS